MSRRPHWHRWLSTSLPTSPMSAPPPLLASMPSPSPPRDSPLTHSRRLRRRLATSTHWHYPPMLPRCTTVCRRRARAVRASCIPLTLLTSRRTWMPPPTLLQWPAMCASWRPTLSTCWATRCTSKTAARTTVWVTAHPSAATRCNRCSTCHCPPPHYRRPSVCCTPLRL